MDAPILMDLKSNQSRLDSIVEKHRNLDAEDVLSLAVATAALNRAITLLAERTLPAPYQKMGDCGGRSVGW